MARPRGAAGMTWQSVRDNPPQTVGLYRLNDCFGHEFMVQWDGRHFRYASGLLVGSVVVRMLGDQWRDAQSNEKEEIQW